jgi:hypothetical protein
MQGKLINIYSLSSECRLKLEFFGTGTGRILYGTLNSNILVAFR